MLMDHVGVSTTSEKSKKNTEFHIDIDKLILHLKRDSDLNEFEHLFMKKLEMYHPTYSLSYEEYFEDPESIKLHNYNLFKFLDVEPVLEKSEHKKLLSSNLSEIIKNYEEVEQALRNSKYEHYLHKK